MKTFRFILIFLAIQAVCAFLAWLGGYNFDQRSVPVAYVTGLCMFAGLVATHAVTQTFFDD